MLVSRNGRQTAVLAAFSTQEQSATAVARLRPQLAAQDVRFGGPDVAFSEINKRTSSDLRSAELLAFPILLLLSFWVFRGLIAAALPLLVGGFAIVITFLVLRLIDAELTGLSIFAVNLVTGMGLGLGIDYSLFVLSRYREELAGGADTFPAIKRTLQTAGRTVLYSSLTVAGALASLLVFPLRFLYSMGIGGMVVALSAGIVALVVLPAVLVALGPRMNSLAPAWLQRSADRSARSSEEGAWFRLGRGVMRRPGLVALATGAVLLAIASPALAPAADPSRRARAAGLLAEPPDRGNAQQGIRQRRLADDHDRRARVPRAQARTSTRSRSARSGRPLARQARPCRRAISAATPGRSNCSRAAPTPRRPTSSWCTGCARSSTRPERWSAARPPGSSTRRPRSPPTCRWRW